MIQTPIVRRDADSRAYQEQLTELWGDVASWLGTHSLEILVGVTFGVAIVFVLLGLRSLGVRICHTKREGADMRRTIGRALAKTRLWFMIAVAAQLIASHAHAPGELASATRFLFIVASVLQAAIWARELILGVIEHRAQANGQHNGLGSAIGIIRLLVTVAIFAIALILILDNLGVNVTGLVAGLGIGGIAIGLAAQGIFSDLFAALSIIFDRPFQVGQMIRFGEAVGRVEAIGLKTTRLRSLDGEQIVVSNAKLLDQPIRNLADIEERRVLLNLQLVYESDPDRLASLPKELEKIIEAEPDCRFIHAWLVDFGPAALVVELLFHVEVSLVERMNEARHRVMIAVLRRLDALEIRLNHPILPPQPERT
jgi:small-conductance mechanosensitive channel